MAGTMPLLNRAPPQPRERRFFLLMALVIFLIVLTGFGSQLVTRHVWFTDFPWQVHVHAVIFSSWICLYLVQNWLVADGANIALHRRLAGSALS